MTIGERRHLALEEELAKRLAAEGLTLYRQGGLYVVEDGDGLPLSKPVTLAEIANWVG